jgi:hypothetical protein
LAWKYCALGTQISYFENKSEFGKINAQLWNLSAHGGLFLWRREAPTMHLGPFFLHFFARLRALSFCGEGGAKSVAILAFKVFLVFSENEKHKIIFVFLWYNKSATRKDFFVLKKLPWTVRIYPFWLHQGGFLSVLVL